MCCCEKPNVNGEFGYRWNNEKAGIYPVNPPEIKEGDTIIFDEPGRCGGLDCHSHHYRLIQARHGFIELLVRHGGGNERIEYLSNSKALVEILKGLDSNARYWFFSAIYHAKSDGEKKARQETNSLWQGAAAEKRIKTRKMKNQSYIKVWIEQKDAH